MDRVPEPELMDDPAQALAYAGADFAEPHGRFVELVFERLPGLPARGRALDLGCGPGDIALRFLRARPGWNVDAIDGSRAMLDLARSAATSAGLADRVRFVEGVLPGAVPPSIAYELVLSNSLLHHLHEPDVLWQTARRWSRPGTRLFVMDLIRPESPDAATGLIDRYAAGEPAVLRRDFYNSLLAAFTPDEIRNQLERASLGHLSVAAVSDRHAIVWGTLPPTVGAA